MNFKYLFAAFMCCGSMFANYAHAETINNETIVTLVKAGLSEGLVIDKINSESCNYDVSTDKIIALKQLGVSDPVIAAMVRRCATLGQQMRNAWAAEGHCWRRRVSGSGGEAFARHL